MAGDSALRTRFLPALLVSLIALIAASLALLPGVQFWDTGELQAVGPLMGTTHPTGFPTYVLLGWLASVVLQPFGEPAFRMNLFSALCVAVAAGVTVDLVRALTGHLILGIATGIGLALTPIAWAIATHAEAHSLHLAFVAILLWLLVAWDARVRAPAGAVETTTDGAHDRRRDDRRATAAAEGAAITDGDPPDPIAPVAPVAKPDRGDRFLVAAAFVFALAVGNHSLTLLLAVPVGLYVLAVDPGIWHRGRLVLTCVAVLVGTVVLVYLELPLRAGPFRSALVYGTPNTLDGFRYIVLAEQFRGSLSNPFGDLPGKVGDLVSLAWSQFGVLALLIPFGFVATVMRHPRYALLTGSAALITFFFAASYVNADIDRYYLGPALMAWTWLAILAAAAIELIETTVNGPVVGVGSGRVRRGSPALGDPSHRPGRRRDRRRPRRGPPRPDGGRRRHTLQGRRREPPARRGQLGQPRLRRRRAERGDPQLVELLDAAVVRPAGPGRAPGRDDHRRPDAPRREPRRPDRDHRRQPREAARLRHPGRPARGQAPRRSL